MDFSTLPCLISQLFGNSGWFRPIYQGLLDSWQEVTFPTSELFEKGREQSKHDLQTFLFRMELIRYSHFSFLLCTTRYLQVVYLVL